MNNGLGRPSEADKYNNVHDYLNKFLFKLKDALFILKEDEFKKKKEYNAAHNRAMLQEDKLTRAYTGLERFRK